MPVTRPSPADRGQVVPLFALVLVAAAAAALLVVEVAAAAGEAARAQAAADAAALAAAVEVSPGGEAAAEAAAGAAARRNGAAVVEVRLDVARREALVRVRLGRAIRAATARVVGPPPSPRHGGAPPALAAALARAEDLLGRPVVVLGATAATVTVDAATAEDLAALQAQTGLCPRSAEGDPVDFAACPPTPP